MRRFGPLLCLMMSACTTLAEDNLTPRCTVDLHCPESMRCYRQFCIDDDDGDSLQVDDDDTRDAGAARVTDARIEVTDGRVDGGDDAQAPPLDVAPPTPTPPATHEHPPAPPAGREAKPKKPKSPGPGAKPPHPGPATASPKHMT